MSKTLKISLIAVILLAGIIMLGAGRVYAADSKIEYHLGNAANDTDGGGKLGDATISQGATFQSIDSFDVKDKTKTDKETLESNYAFTGWKVTQKDGAKEYLGTFAAGASIPTDKGSLRAVAQWGSKIVTYSIKIQDESVAEKDVTGGKISVNANTVNAGESCVVTVTPSTGYELEYLKVNGTPVDVSGGTYTVSNISADINVDAAFKLKVYSVSTNVVGDVGGAISANPTSVTHGNSCTITLVPDTGYEVASLEVNGETVSVTDNSYTISSVTEDTTVNVTFKLKEFTINVNSEVEHGSISSKDSKVTYGSDCTITIEPDEGYEIASLMVKGSDVKEDVTTTDGGKTYTYTFQVTSEEDANVVVAFKIKEFPVNTSVIGANGTISSSASMVQYGDGCTITLIPAIGYRVDYLEINGIRSYGIEGNMYVIENIKQAYDIKVAYAKLPFVITIKSVEGATIDPSRSLIVFYNDSQTFTIKANEGYKLVSVKVNGEEQSLPLENDKLVLTNITEHKTVDVVVEKIKFQVTTNVKGGNGEITSGKVVEYGDNFIIDFTPAEGYMIDTLTINGEDIEIAENVYRIENIKEDYDVEVSYTKIPFTLKIEDADNATISPVGSLVVYYGDNQVINIKAIRGYKLVSVTVNGKEQELPLTDDSLELKGITEDTVVIAKIEKETYYVVEGKDQTYNNDGELVVKFNGDLDLFVKLLINGEELDASKYTTESGSTVVKLSQAYLDSLPDGTYTMTAVYSNGNTAETTFTIARNNSNNPTTGDAIALSIAILAVSLAGIIITVKKFKKAK